MSYTVTLSPKQKAEASQIKTNMLYGMSKDDLVSELMKSVVREVFAEKRITELEKENTNLKELLDKALQLWYTLYMKSLITLKNEALGSCNFRGHSMGKWLTVKDRKAATSECEICGAWVQVQTNPAANDIDIGGTAVAMGCTSAKAYYATAQEVHNQRQKVVASSIEEALELFNNGEGTDIGESEYAYTYSDVDLADITEG